MRKLALMCALIMVCLVPLASAQDGYFTDWFPRVDKTQAEQPHWITPLATTTPRLEEEVRYDQWWQRAGIDSLREGGSHFQCASLHRAQ